MKNKDGKLELELQEQRDYNMNGLTGEEQSVLTAYISSAKINIIYGDRLERKENGVFIIHDKTDNSYKDKEYYDIRIKMEWNKIKNEKWWSDDSKVEFECIHDEFVYDLQSEFMYDNNDNDDFFNLDE